MANVEKRMAFIEMIRNWLLARVSQRNAKRRHACSVRLTRCVSSFPSSIRRANAASNTMAGVFFKLAEGASGEGLRKLWQVSNEALLQMLCHTNI